MKTTVTTTTVKVYMHAELCKVLQALEATTKFRATKQFEGREPCEELLARVIRVLHEGTLNFTRPSVCYTEEELPPPPPRIEGNPESRTPQEVRLLLEAG